MSCNSWNFCHVCRSYVFFIFMHLSQLNIVLNFLCCRNYVIQYIIELKIPSSAATLLSQFEGNFAFLSMQKFSSHVVEKCLRCLEGSQPIIIKELLSVPHFDQLLQDRFANYVLQSALEVTKVGKQSQTSFIFWCLWFLDLVNGNGRSVYGFLTERGGSMNDQLSENYKFPD